MLFDSANSANAVRMEMPSSGGGHWHRLVVQRVQRQFCVQEKWTDWVICEHRGAL